MSRLYALLTTNRFFPLFLTQMLGAFNDNVFRNALVVLVTYRLAEQVGISASLLVTLALALFMLPYFLCSATAGQLADKYEPARSVRRLKLIELLLMLVTAIAFYLEHVWALLGLLSLMGMQSAFFGPLKYTMLPQQLRREELIPGNALVEAGTFMAILLGTITGGILVLAPLGTLWIACVIVGVAVLGFISAQFIPAGHEMHPELQVQRNPLKATWRIVQHAYRFRLLFMAMLGISWFWMVGSVFLSVFPLYAKDVVGGDETIVTLFLTLFSIGVALGALLCQLLLRRFPAVRVIPLACLLMGGWMLLLSAMPVNLSEGEMFVDAWYLLSQPIGWLLVVLLTAIASCAGMFIVPLNTMIQIRSKPEERAQMIAANNVINAFFMVLTSGIIAAVLGAGYGVVVLFLLFGLGCLPVSWLVLRVLRLAQLTV